MKKSKVYTRGGDKGETSLVSGTRIPKSDERIHLYGEVDELNSYLGVVISHLQAADIKSDLDLFFAIQSSLFDLGSNLACESEFHEKYRLPQIPVEFIETIESRIDECDSVLEPMKYFILPGGHIASSHLQVARTICRRVERQLVRFFDIPVNSVEFVNRLSDFLFVYARYVNHLKNEKESPWIPK